MRNLVLFSLFSYSDFFIKSKVKFTFIILYLHLDCDGIQWGNNYNELNASYAPDGYVCIRGIGVSDKI